MLTAKKFIVQETGVKVKVYFRMDTLTSLKNIRVY